MKTLWGKFKEQDKSGSGAPLVTSLAIVGVMFVVTMGIYVAVAHATLDRSNQVADQLVEISTETTSTSQETTSTVVSASEPLNWQPLLTVLAVAVGIVILVGLIALVVWTCKKYSTNRKTIADQVKEESSRWRRARERHLEAVKIVASYETDIGKAIDYPAMNDVTVESTSSMFKAMREVNNIWETLRLDTKMAKKGIYGSKESLDRYESLVADFENKVAVAERQAKLINWSNLSNAEQKDLQTAKFLLKHASNPGNTQDMRYTYMKKLQEVVERVNQRHQADLLPPVTVNQIEESTRLLLTDGAEALSTYQSDDSRTLVVP